MITHEELLKVFKYNKDTGEASYKNEGWVCKYGYRCFKINGKNYRLNRLAWFYEYKVWPIGVIDHIDEIKLNNKLINLRDVNTSTNLLNRKQPNKNNILKVLGVYKVGNKYRARIKVNGIQKHLGYFLTIEEAKVAYTNYKEFICA